MKANLLYIHEDNLTPAFQNKLCSLHNGTIPLFIIVQLKVAPNGFKPMINNLKEIRIEKAKRKIKDWIYVCLGAEPVLLIKIVDKNAPKIDVDIDFKEIKYLTAFCLQEDSKRVHSYIGNKFSKNNFEISFL